MAPCSVFTVMRAPSDVAQGHHDRPPVLQEEPEITLEGGGFVEDRKRSMRLVRRIDSRILPLCAFVYLLNYLDRGNIGNGKVRSMFRVLQKTGVCVADRKRYNRFSTRRRATRSSNARA